MKILKRKSYWYGVYKHSVYPVLLEYVQDTENKKWDDALLEAIDFVVETLLGPDDASVAN